jgi:hypothetical protein
MGEAEDTRTHPWTTLSPQHAGDTTVASCTTYHIRIGANFSAEEAEIPNGISLGTAIDNCHILSFPNETDQGLMRQLLIGRSSPSLGQG